MDVDDKSDKRAEVRAGPEEVEDDEVVVLVDEVVEPDKVSGVAGAVDAAVAAADMLMVSAPIVKVEAASIFALVSMCRDGVVMPPAAPPELET